MKLHRSLYPGICALAICLSSAPAHAASGYSAPALFNEANAELRAGHPGPAILHYEQARLLSPHDPAIARNLRVARARAGVSEPTVPAWQRPAHALSLNALAILVSICLLLLAVLFLGNRLLASALRGLGFQIASVLGAVALLSAGAIALRWPELSRAVVLPAQAAVHLAPARDSETLFQLPAGELIHPRAQHGDFALVRTEDGHSGWLEKSAFAPIVPPPANPSTM